MTEKTLERVNQFLDYMATHPYTVIRVYASDMILNVHSDASYQTVSKMQSRPGGYFFLGSMPKNGNPIILNGNMCVLSADIKLVVSPAAEAELVALFLNAQQARIIRLILHEMSHPQPPTPIHIDNNTCVRIINNTQKRSKSRAMHGKYFWFLDCGGAQKEFSFRQHPGQENIGNYLSNAHTGTTHKHVRPYYVHMEILPRTLTRVMMPSSRQGCAELLDDLYYHRVPLPRISWYYKLDKQARLADVHDRHAAPNTWHVRLISLARSV